MLFCLVVSLPVSQVGLQVVPRLVYISPPIHNDVSRNQAREYTISLLILAFSLGMLQEYTEAFA